jgi:pimeloyl-ACP methyl ester carboxylesterase
MMDRITSKDGTQISYTQIGSGPPLLFVHGTTADHGSWGKITPLLAPHFTVYAMDRRGRGESGDAPDYSFDREAQDVAALVDSIGGPVFLFGHSYGGLCCLEAALLTANVARLVLYEPDIPTGAEVLPAAMLGRMQSLIERGALEAAMEMMLKEVVHMPDHELEAYRQSPLWAARIPLAATIPRELKIDRTYRFNPQRFANFRVPTLLLLGSDSPGMFRQAIEALDAALPDSRVEILPGQQHMAHHSNPDLLAEVVTRFLGG